MAGILNNKTRMMDTIITREGRRQIVAGDLKVKFVTFTDRHTFYRQDDDDVADDADNRIQLEAFHRPQDQIIFETDDEGRFLPFEGADIKIRRGKLYRASGRSHEQITGSNVPEAIYELLESSANNFKDQQIIGTKDIYSETHDFVVFPETVTFNITDEAPFKDNEISDVEIEKVESLHQDKRLQHLPFYQYLPPVNTPKPGYIEGEPLGHYARLNQDSIMTYNELIDELADKDYADIQYLDTSRENNLVMQLLETKPDSVEKLALIDFGEFPSDNDPESAGRHVYFAGKIFEDGSGMQTFVNMFTIIFE
jgi:nucleoid DNA-binding protein